VPNADELCMCSSDSHQLHLLVKQAQVCGRECTTTFKSSVVDWWFQIFSTSSNMAMTPLAQVRCLVTCATNRLSFTRTQASCSETSRLRYACITRLQCEFCYMS
jgi:hypothetical protein